MQMAGASKNEKTCQEKFSTCPSNIAKAMLSAMVPFTRNRPSLPQSKSNHVWNSVRKLNDVTLETLNEEISKFSLRQNKMYS